MRKKAFSLARGISISLASFVLGYSSLKVYGNEAATQPAIQVPATTHPASRHSLEETVYELPGVEKEEIKEVEVRKPKFSIPEIKIPFVISFSEFGGSGLRLKFDKKDYDEAIKELNKDGSSYSIDKKTGKIKALTEPSGRKTVLKNLEGKVLYKVKRGNKEVCVFDNRNTGKSVMAEYIDFVSKIGLMKGESFGNVLFDTESGKIVYREKAGEILAFSDTGQAIVGVKEKGYFLRDVKTREGVMLFKYQEGVDFFMSPNGEFVAWKAKDAGDVGVYRPSTKDVRYLPFKDSVVKVDDEGNVYTKDKKSERKVNFSEMMMPEETE